MTSAVILLLILSLLLSLYPITCIFDFLFRQFQESILKIAVSFWEEPDNITFHCINRNEISSFHLKWNSLEHIGKLNLDINTAFLVHGWLDDRNITWLEELQLTWVNYQDWNVCNVDWSNFARRKYIPAILHVFQVGQKIAETILHLESYGFNREDITLVGYSLGAHAVGYTGYMLEGKLGQIIGLDPAGPLFTMPSVVSSEYRLDETDARYVQIMHTSGGTFGTALKSGHADFFPNGGTSPQLDCVMDFSLMTGQKPSGCSHGLVLKIFKLSLNPRNVFVGKNCSSYSDFLLSRCDDGKKGIFGVHTKRKKGNFYFKLRVGHQEIT